MVIWLHLQYNFKDPNKVKRIRNYALKCNLYLYFLILQKLQISGKKCWCQSSRGVIYIFYIMSFLSCHLYIFWIFFNQSILVPSFIMVGYVRQILGPRLPPIHEQPLKGPSWIAFLFLKKLQTFRPQHRCIPIAKFLIIRNTGVFLFWKTSANDCCIIFLMIHYHTNLKLQGSDCMTTSGFKVESHV